MNVMGYSLFLDAVEARPSVTSISVHLHIENTTANSIRPFVRGRAKTKMRSSCCPGILHGKEDALDNWAVAWSDRHHTARDCAYPTGRGLLPLPNLLRKMGDKALKRAV